MNKMVKTTFLSVALFGSSALLADDFITLKKSDKNGSRAEGQSSFMSSFLHNPTEEGYGWSDGNDPDGTKDYKVTCTLRTPCEWNIDFDKTTYTFPGRSLTLQGKNAILAFRSSWDGGTATVCVPNLIARGGAGLSNEQWSRSVKWSGQITVEDSAWFSVNMNTCYIYAQMIAPDSSSVTLTGQSIVSANDEHRWMKDRMSNKYLLLGDCTAYAATNLCQWGARAFVGTANIAGSFNLGNFGTLTLDSGVSSVAVGGSVVSRDGIVIVPADKSLDIRSGIDSGFATFESHVYKGTNVYTRLPSSEPYENSNFVTEGETTKAINVLTVEADATLATTCADLDGTLVQLAAGATLTSAMRNSRTSGLTWGAERCSSSRIPTWRNRPFCSPTW